ncbi:MAG: hypothetical protein GIW95_01940 [Candidatus Eremiobacteraeota bacterium]|nr:hypothetical protein [Candidatus Eremiobacteraeota bacterium]
MSEDYDRKSGLEALATLLISFRAGEGLSVEEAAEDAQIEPERLAAAEAAELALTESELDGLAEVYGISVSAFFGGRTTPISYLFGV